MNPQFALQFAAQVLVTAGKCVSHLKLQKLMFYAYGAARAAGELSHCLTFSHWKHGPVCVPVYDEYKTLGSSLLEAPDGVRSLDGAARDAIRVYGVLSAWQLRQESHLEQPWIDAEYGCVISDEDILSHFERKFTRGYVEAPKNMSGAWSLAVDALPPLSAPTLSALADELEKKPFE